MKNYEKCYRDLLSEDFSSPNWSLKSILETWTEIKESLDEYFANLYIKYTCDTQNKEKFDAYTKAIEEMEIFSPLHHQMERKILEAFPNPSPEFSYAIQLLKNDMTLFREENIPLETEESKLSQEYQAHIGSLSIEHEGKSIPLPMAKPLLENPDRSLREKIFGKICRANAGVSESIDEIFQKQVKIRDTIAHNANFKNYRDFVHQAKARFDYTPNDCLNFSQAILEEIVPMSSFLYRKRKEQLGLSSLSPFDLSVDPSGKDVLRPARTEKDFLQKTIDVLKSVSPDVGETLRRLDAEGRLDLFSRQGKAPGGYNYPLPISKTSFIFMNCAFVHQDAATIFHEAGHAYHFDLYKNHLDPFLYKSPSSEIAELASMSMELMSMEHWELLYPDSGDLRRAKQKQLEGIVQFFPWMAIVDSFQHWIYLNPKATIAERNGQFEELYHKFLPEISWAGWETYLPTQWHKQLHIVELPFYYIEYGIAQLGALQIWKWYKENPQEGLARYRKALSFASRGPIRKAYEQAGIDIAFTPEYVRSLMDFLEREIQELV